MSSEQAAAEVADGGAGAESASLPAQLPAPRLSDASWWEVLAVLAAAFFPSFWAGITARFSEGTPGPYWLGVAENCPLLVCECTIVLYIIHRTGAPWAQFGIVRPALGDVALALMIFAFSLIIFAAWRMLTPLLPFLEFGDAKATGPGPQRTADYVLMAVEYLVVGFTEELAYRAYLLTRLPALLGSRVQALVASSFLFGVAHTQYGPGGMADVMVLGALYGCVYWWVRRIWPIALGHAFHNIVTMGAWH